MRLPALLVAGAVLCGLSPAPVQAASQKHGFLYPAYRDPEGTEHRFALFVPYAYNGEKPFPLIVFLHGSGEGGTNPRRPVGVGIGEAVRKQEKTFPFFVLFPQALDPDWEDRKDHERVIAELDQVEKDYKVDTKRVYLTGLSSGGDGTWLIAEEYPDRWAAIFPICGEGDPANMPKLKNIPIWFFMGSADDPHDVKTAHAQVAALKAEGAPLTYTEYPGMNHYIWNRTYDRQDLYDWLLKQHK